MLMSFFLSMDSIMREKKMLMEAINKSRESERKVNSFSIRRRMHLNTIRSMLNQALRDNAALGP